MTTLFETIIGSHIWQMNHEQSDTDIFRCTLADTKDILLGKEPKNEFTRFDKIDLQISELSTVINQLKVCNFNYLVAVHSPIVRFSNYNILEKLKDISERGISKQAYDSIHGLALQNYKKYIESGIDNSPKRCAVINRTLMFGIKLLLYGKLEFTPVDLKSANSGKLQVLMSELDNAKTISPLPDKCPQDIAYEYDEFLLRIRENDIIRRHFDKYNELWL